MSKLALQLISENKRTKSRVLKFTNIGLQEIPKVIEDCIWLEELYLEGNENLSELSPLTWLLNLRILDCRGTQVKNLSHLKRIISLRKIYISNTQVVDIAPLASLTNLQKIDCFSTQISNLTPLTSLINLQQLDCRNTQVADLIPLLPLTNLQQLDCSNTKILDLSPLSRLSNIQKIACAHTKVSDISPLASLTNLQHLDCQRTQVTDLLPLASLTNLQHLDCQRTQVANLLPLASLVNLKYLDCSKTTVDSLTPLAELLNLKQLSCFSTQVSDLSPLKDLVNLQQLDCSNTNIANISSLNCLSNLRQLKCFSTKINDLSPLNGLLDLQHLDCRDTQICDLLPILPLIKKGKKVEMKEYGGDLIFNNCPLTTPPIEIIKKGNEAIIKYFEEIELAQKTGSVIRLAEAKCLILGEGGAGKTSLTRKLLNHDNPLPEEHETTKGIEVHPLDWKLPDGSDFRLNIWDFGGQEIYHATHQFFLTKRSIYILLDDTRKDEKTVNDPTFNYWLQIAELYGGGSPLLIVQNEKGDRTKQLNTRSLKTRFGFVKDVKATNLLTCRGLDKVREAIKYWVKDLPHIGEEQPKSWLDIRRELERLAIIDKRDHISLEEYYRICAEHTIPERERALFLSGYLHDFGAFLHFQEHPLLRKTLVLNNQWATDAVYKVLDHEPVKRAFGHFTRHDLASIWAADRYADQHEELLALMEKFELCYKLPDEKTETWLAPQLLSVLQPEELTWADADNLQLRYEYEFMPKGLLSQHIVRMNRYVRRPELAWKSGVVFERAGAQALVTEAWGSGKISLRARGVQAKELLTLLSEDFDNMHARLEGLKVKKMIPCNCRVCSKTVEPHFYDYEKLAKRRVDGKRTVECDVSYEDVQVLGLLDGVLAKVSSRDRKAMVDSHRFTKPGATKVFISYSKHDHQHKDTLLKHLSGLRDKVVTWHDRDILPGEDWDERIKTALHEADVVLYLVTHNSLATEYIQQVELPVIEERCATGECILVPVIVDFCVWTELDFAKRNALPEKGVAVTDPKWKNENQAWMKVVEGIQRILAARNMEE